MTGDSIDLDALLLDACLCVRIQIDLVNNPNIATALRLKDWDAVGRSELFLLYINVVRYLVDR